MQKYVVLTNSHMLIVQRLEYPSLLLARSHRDDKKKPPIPKDRWLFLYSKLDALYFLCRCRFNSLRCLCLRIFLRRFLITLPTMSPHLIRQITCPTVFNRFFQSMALHEFCNRTGKSDDKTFFEAPLGHLAHRQCTKHQSLGSVRFAL